MSDYNIFMIIIIESQFEGRVVVMSKPVLNIFHALSHLIYTTSPFPSFIHQDTENQ